MNSRKSSADVNNFASFIINIQHRLNDLERQLAHLQQQQQQREAETTTNRCHQEPYSHHHYHCSCCSYSCRSATSQHTDITVGCGNNATCACQQRASVTHNHRDDEQDTDCRNETADNVETNEQRLVRLEQQMAEIATRLMKEKGDVLHCSCNNSIVVAVPANNHPLDPCQNASSEFMQKVERHMSRTDSKLLQLESRINDQLACDDVTEIVDTTEELERHFNAKIVNLQTLLKQAGINEAKPVADANLILAKYTVLEERIDHLVESTFKLGKQKKVQESAELTVVQQTYFENKQCDQSAMIATAINGLAANGTLLANKQEELMEIVGIMAENNIPVGQYNRLEVLVDSIAGSCVSEDETRRLIKTQIDQEIRELRDLKVKLTDMELKHSELQTCVDAVTCSDDKELQRATRCRLSIVKQIQLEQEKFKKALEKRTQILRKQLNKHVTDLISKKSASLVQRVATPTINDNTSGVLLDNMSLLIGHDDNNNTAVKPFFPAAADNLNKSVDQSLAIDCSNSNDDHHRHNNYSTELEEVLLQETLLEFTLPPLPLPPLPHPPPHSPSTPLQQSPPDNELSSLSLLPRNHKISKTMPHNSRSMHKAAVVSARRAVSDAKPLVPPRLTTSSTTAIIRSAHEVRQLTDSAADLINMRRYMNLDPSQLSMPLVGDTIPTVKCVLLGDKAAECSKLLSNFLECENVPMRNALLPIRQFACYDLVTTVGGQRYHLALIDASSDSGPSKFRALCYPNTDVFVVCFSVITPETFKSLKTSWVPEVRKHSPTVCLIVAGTHVDKRIEPSVVQALSKRSKKPVSFEKANAYVQKLKTATYVECSLDIGLDARTVFVEAITSLAQISPLPWTSKTKGFFSK